MPCLWYPSSRALNVILEVWRMTQSLGAGILWTLCSFLYRVSNLGAPGDVSCPAALPLDSRAPRGGWTFPLRLRAVSVLAKTQGAWHITPTVAFCSFGLIRCWSLRFSPYSKRGDLDLSSPFLHQRIWEHVLQSSHNFSFWKLCFPMPTVVCALSSPLSSSVVTPDNACVQRFQQRSHFCTPRVGYNATLLHT